MQTPSILLPLDCLLPSRSFFSFHINLSLFFWTVPTSPTHSFSLFFLVFHSRFLLFQVLYSNDRINRWLLVYCYSTVLHFICFSLVLFRHWCTTYIQTLTQRPIPRSSSGMCYFMPYVFLFLLSLSRLCDSIYSFPLRYSCCLGQYHIVFWLRALRVNTIQFAVSFLV